MCHFFFVLQHLPCVSCWCMQHHKGYRDMVWSTLDWGCHWLSMPLKASRMQECRTVDEQNPRRTLVRRWRRLKASSEYLGALHSIIPRVQEYQPVMQPRLRKLFVYQLQKAPTHPCFSSVSQLDNSKNRNGRGWYNYLGPIQWFSGSCLCSLSS